MRGSRKSGGQHCVGQLNKGWIDKDAPRRGDTRTLIDEHESAKLIERCVEYIGQTAVFR